MGGLSLTCTDTHGPMTGKQVSDEELLNVFRASSRPFMLTSDVVDNVAIQKRAVQKRLNKLEDDGRLEYLEAGSAHIWVADGEPTEPVGTRGRGYSGRRSEPNGSPRSLGSSRPPAAPSPCS